MLYPDNNTSIGMRVLLAELLADVLGTYPGGGEAVWIEPPAEPLKAVGLRVIIQDQPIQLTNEIYQWSLVLAQDDLSESGLAKFNAAITKMRGRFPRKTEQILPFTEESERRALFLLPFHSSCYPNSGY